MAAGARQVFLVDEPVAAALGAGLQIRQPHGCMVVDIGGGSTDIAVISMGGRVKAASLPVAGNAFDNCIAQYVQEKFQIAIGPLTAEQLKSRWPAAPKANLRVLWRCAVILGRRTCLPAALSTPAISMSLCRSWPPALPLPPAYPAELVRDTAPSMLPVSRLVFAENDTEADELYSRPARRWPTGGHLPRAAAQRQTRLHSGLLRAERYRELHGRGRDRPRVAGQGAGAVFDCRAGE